MKLYQKLVLSILILTTLLLAAAIVLPCFTTTRSGMKSNPVYKSMDGKQIARQVSLAGCTIILGGVLSLLYIKKSKRDAEAS
jgi:hypothetical protein